MPCRRASCSSSPLLEELYRERELLPSAGADKGALGADLVPSSRRPMVTRGKSRWRWGGPGWDEGDAVGTAAACLWLCWGQQRGAGTTGLLPPFPSQQDQSSALRREDSPEEWCCSSPGDFPGVPAAGGSPCTPGSVFSLPGGDVCRRQSWNGANSLSTVTLNSGLSFF